MTQTTPPNTPYPTVTSDADFVAIERDILAFWSEQQVFQASVDTRPATHDDGSSNAYVFYDGPPFANGLPHHGHLLTGFVKDMVARYQTMRGKRVERRFGWDCHGLPAEMEAQKQLGVSGRQEIIGYGIDKFNAHCRTSVMRYRDDWEEYVNRQARWVDFDNDYKTMDTPYMESVIWAFSELHKKGLVYEGFKVMPYSWAAETVLSNAEIRLDDATREKEDKAVTVAFKLKDTSWIDLHHSSDEVYVLAWTTTPWTLPSNLALAVSSELEYSGSWNAKTKRWELSVFDKIKSKGHRGDVDFDTIRKERLHRLTIPGSKLLDQEYEPLFPYFANHENAFRILDGTDFIEAGSGTGIVHMAPGFGEDDMRVCAENGIGVTVPVNDAGQYSDAIYDYAEIETERCILKRLSYKDEANFIRLHTNEQVMATVNDGLMSEEQARENFAANMAHFAQHGYGQYAVYHKETGAFIGRAGLNMVAQTEAEPARPTLRCALMPEFWRGGYGREVCRAALRIGFEMFDLPEIAGGAIADNPRSHEMMKSIGLKHIKDVQFAYARGPYFLLSRDEFDGGEHAFNVRSLQLKGLNVIKETSGKTDAEPYNDAQLEKYGLANLRIIQWLKGTGQLVKQEDYAHNYPHCWRTDQPIIYRAMSSWFVDVPKIRDRMVELNQQINWIPSHIKDGRFGKWIENAREWSVSRSRFWGCPLPVWRSDNPDNDTLYVFGSVAELEDFFGVEVPDLHKPFIDTLTKPDPTNENYTLRRVDEVFDCWFESGSMPYAQVHYPFENKEWFEANYPADFIVEYEAQTRGWFYNMTVLSVALFDNIPFKNCICHGVVLDDQGRKLSKRLQNFVDPKILFDKYGSDALRWFMLSSTIMRGNELYLDPQGDFIRDAVRLYIKPLWNAYHFFCLYANADGVEATLDMSSDNIMDRYILVKLAACVEEVRKALDAYDTPTACAAISAFFELLNNWYIRRNRARFWEEQITDDKRAAYNTLYSVLHVMCRVAAPFLPQITEHMYAGLINSGAYQADQSVHLARFPDEVREVRADDALMQSMDRVRDICNVAHAIRNDVNVRIRQPLATLTVYQAKLTVYEAYFKQLIADETNVKSVVLSDSMEGVAERALKINFKVVGKRLGAKMKAITAAAKAGDWSVQDDGSVAVAGELLTPDECEFALISTIKEGAAALSAQDGLVVLDTALTPELLQEGIARDVVRLIQQSRKDAGFDVSDRIVASVHAAPSVQEAIQAHQTYICEQTLTDGFVAQPPAGASVFEYNVADTPLTLSVMRQPDGAQVASA